MKPTVKPVNPNFSSGPCSKRPGYALSALPSDILGRSHRSSLGKSRLAKAITETKSLLGLPADYRVGIVPASRRGAGAGWSGAAIALSSGLGPFLPPVEDARAGNLPDAGNKAHPVAPASAWGDRGAHRR